jgi:hypothetical protein
MKYRVLRQLVYRQDGDGNTPLFLDLQVNDIVELLELDQHK